MSMPETSSRRGYAASSSFSDGFACSGRDRQILDEVKFETDDLLYTVRLIRSYQHHQALFFP